jgi:hypothetical protein
VNGRRVEEPGMGDSFYGEEQRVPAAHVTKMVLFIDMYCGT